MKKTFLCLSLAISTASCLGMDIGTGKLLHRRDKTYQLYVAIRTALKLSNQNYLPTFPKGPLYLLSAEEELALRPQIFANPLACETIFLTLCEQIGTKKKSRIEILRTTLELSITCERAKKGPGKVLNQQCIETQEELNAVKGRVEKGETTLAQIIEKIIENSK